MQKSLSDYRALEQVMKGFANHYRLKILNILKREPGLSVYEIAGRLQIGYMNASDHLRKMFIAGLLLKRSDGTAVRHTLTPRAGIILEFCKKLK